MDEQSAQAFIETLPLYAGPAPCRLIDSESLARYADSKAREARLELVRRVLEGIRKEEAVSDMVSVLNCLDAIERENRAGGEGEESLIT